MALDALHTALMSQRVNWVLDAERGCSRTGSPTDASSGLSGCGLRPVSWKAVSGVRRIGERRRVQASARSWPTSSCTRRNGLSSLLIRYNEELDRARRGPLRPNVQ